MNELDKLFMIKKDFLSKFFCTVVREIRFIDDAECIACCETGQPLYVASRNAYLCKDCFLTSGAGDVIYNSYRMGYIKFPEIDNGTLSADYQKHKEKNAKDNCSVSRKIIHLLGEKNHHRRLEYILKATQGMEEEERTHFLYIASCIE